MHVFELEQLTVENEGLREREVWKRFYTSLAIFPTKKEAEDVGKYWIDPGDQRVKVRKARKAEVEKAAPHMDEPPSMFTVTRYVTIRGTGELELIDDEDVHFALESEAQAHADRLNEKETDPEYVYHPGHIW